MAIKKLILSNFKSFRKLEIEPGNFNVLIGANASGKSNFIQAFKFLRDIVKHGLENAISMQGGIGYLRNKSIGAAEELSIEVVVDYPIDFSFYLGNLVSFIPNGGIYDVSFKFNKRGLGFGISQEKFAHKGNLAKIILGEKKGETRTILEEGQIIFSNINRDMNFDLALPDGTKISEEDFSPSLVKEQVEKLSKLSPKALMLQGPLHFLNPLQSEFRNISIYDFDTKLPKKAVPIMGMAELEEDGSNLAIVLKSIKANGEKKRKLSNLMKDILPYIKDINVKETVDKSLLFRLQEGYSGKHYFPASFISDGTISIIASIVALYFEKKGITVIEEPEKNIHPHLISKLVNMMKDASRNKQIFITTHNPEIVKHAGLENILLVSRDKDGFSTISRPSDKKELNTFFKNEIGIEELFVQDLLG